MDRLFSSYTTFFIYKFKIDEYPRVGKRDQNPLENVGFAQLNYKYHPSQRLSAHATDFLLGAL